MSTIAQQFGDIMTAVGAEQAAAAPVVDTPAPVEAAPAETPAPETPQVEAAPEPTPEAPAAPAPTVAMTRYNERVREIKREQAAREAAEAKVAELEQKLAALAVKDNPQAAAPKTGESEEDWLARLVDEGETLNPKLAEFLKKQEEKLAALEQKVTTAHQFTQTQQEAAAQARFDQTLSAIKERCPGAAEPQILQWLSDGIKPSAIVSFFTEARALAQPAAAPAAQPAAPRPAPPPRLDAPATPAKLSTNEDITLRGYHDWLSGLTAN